MEVGSGASCCGVQSHIVSYSCYCQIYPWTVAGKARHVVAIAVVSAAAAVSHEQFVAIIYKINEMHFMAT